MSKQTKQSILQKNRPFKKSLHYWDEARKEQMSAELLLQIKEQEFKDAKRWLETTKVVAEKRRKILDEWIDENALGETGRTRSLKDNLVNKFRSFWQFIPRDDEKRRIALAVIHGIVERTGISQLEQAKGWALDIADKIESKQEVNACQIESQARDLGLSVLDQERDPIGIRALFGVVSEIEEGEARLSMSIPEGRTDPTLPLWESYWVPIVDLPECYAIENVWIVWVERTYLCTGVKSQKGRFEPASNSPKKIPKKIFETYAKPYESLMK